MRQTSVNYARALDALSVPETDVREAASIFEKAPGLKKVLASPVIAKERKEHLIDRLFPEAVRNFLKVACVHGRTAQLGEIFESYEALLREQKGILKAELFYVTPPSEEQLWKMKQFLRRIYNKNDVLFDKREDSSLLSGFILRAGDFEFDYSLKGYFERLEQQLTRR